MLLSVFLFPSVQEAAFESGEGTPEGFENQIIPENSAGSLVFAHGDAEMSTPSKQMRNKTDRISDWLGESLFQE